MTQDVCRLNQVVVGHLARVFVAVLLSLFLHFLKRLLSVLQPLLLRVLLVILRALPELLNLNCAFRSSLGVSAVHPEVGFGAGDALFLGRTFVLRYLV